MEILNVRALSKSFDKGKSMVLDQVSFSLSEDTICAIVGESGGGKTTLLRLIAGLESSDYGEIILYGNSVSSLSRTVPPQQRNVGMVFQDFALFPHLTVAQNIAYGLFKSKQERVLEMLKLVSMDDYDARYPHELSGGQKQRVAIARALAPQPKLLLLDEPFSNLDTILKSQLRTEVRAILKKSAVTALMITHDPLDALVMADQILFLSNGKLIEQGMVQDLAQNPQTDYVKAIFDQLRSNAATSVNLLG